MLELAAETLLDLLRLLSLPFLLALVAGFFFVLDFERELEAARGFALVLVLGFLSSYILLLFCQLSSLFCGLTRI